MIDRIRELKQALLSHMEKRTANLDRADYRELGEYADMLKDLSEAERACEEAAYYRSVAYAMERPSGYSQPFKQDRKAYDDVVDKVEQEFRSLTQEERKAMRGKIMTVLGAI